MQITVINLASQPRRWSESKRQFEGVGLNAVRLDAVRGKALCRQQTGGCYSERLNSRQYHRPLRAGEIGCYASHLVAWQRLIDSGDAAMAVFEDDLEIESDLPQVLAAIEAAAPQVDIVKLIGRPRERIRSSRPLADAAFGGTASESVSSPVSPPMSSPGSANPLVRQRQLIAYRRVPSLTGAYVVTREGAQKLLARRQPFGRPVDVDLRHWWECDLRVRGVHPYPVRGAPSAEVSTIGSRENVPGLRRRFRKIVMQGRYTAANWAAVRQESANHRAAEGPPERRAASHADRAAGAEASCRAPEARRRNLVIVRAGDASLHRLWLNAPTRDFDVFISYYGTTPGRYRDEADLYEARPGPKWPCIAALLRQHAGLLAQYEAFWFPDDDLAIDSASVDRMFAFFCAYRLCLAQPALTADSYFTWRTLLRDPRCHIRYGRFVEVMAPIFSRAALQVCEPTFSQSPSGWGLDWVWPTLCAQAELGRIAVIDATPVRHTRPVGGELYRNHPSLDGKADAARILRAYGIQEVRAIAKYSFEGGVRDVALPWAQRLLFWLKRLNGRRKHPVHA